MFVRGTVHVRVKVQNGLETIHVAVVDRQVERRDPLVSPRADILTGVQEVTDKIAVSYEMYKSVLPSMMDLFQSFHWCFYIVLRIFHSHDGGQYCGGGNRL